MKKLLKTLPVLIFVLIFSLTGLGGCQIFSAPQPEQGNIDQTPRDRRIGVIQSLGGVKTNSQGTNLLTMDDGTTILLKSVAINLDDTKYASKKVEVSGVLTYTTDGKQIMVVENIDVLDQAPVTQQQTTVVSWRDYVNAGLGIQVRYRDDFTLTEDKSSLTFTRPVGPSAVLVTTQETSSSPEMSTKHLITVTVQSHTPSQTLLKDFIKLSDDKSSTLLASGYNKSKIGQSGLVAYKKVDGENVSFAFEGDGRFYLVTYTGGNDSQSIEDQNVFYDFLASFQLLNGATSTQQVPESDTVNNRPSTESKATNDSSMNTDTSPSGKAAGTETSPPPSTETNNTTSVTTIPADSAPIVPPVGTSSSENAATLSATQELLPGYSMFTSSGYKFNLQYPKGWYYGQTPATDSNVVRRYDFGSKPVDTEPGSVNFDIVSGGLPSGTTYTVGDKTLTKTTDGDTVSYSYKGKTGRVYRVTGPSGMDISLRNMMETLQEQ